MATYEYENTEEVSTTNDIFSRYLSVSNINTRARDNIPKYSKINSVTAKIRTKRGGVNLSTSNANAAIYFASESSFAHNDGVDLQQWNNEVTTSYKEFSADMTGYVVSQKANAGEISSPANNYSRLYFQVDCTISRKLYINLVGTYYDYTPPTYKINVSTNGGGTVSGGGTFNVTIADQTKTITATPNSGYKFVKWTDSNGKTYTTASLNVTISQNSISAHSTSVTYTATFEKSAYTVTFKKQDGTTVKTSQIQSGSTLGTLPTVSRSGYTFAGWIPCEPAKKTDGTVLDSYKYNGDSSSVHALDKKYKYTNKLSVHIEAYMSNWEDIASLKAQIISCTEGGGWGLGYQANSTGHGAELYAGGYKGIDLGLGTAGKFSNNTWYSFDIVFSNGTFEAYVNGTKKGTQTTSNTAISYHSENTIFVGAEAATSATTPGGNYFKGFISNVFIANQSTRLEIATTSTVVDKNIEYYPVWRINTTRTATFKNYDGTVLQTLQVEYGRTPSYTGSTPTRATTAEYTYTFSGWNPSVGAITSNTEYVAQFTATKRKYTITASGTNGSVSGGGTYEYNSSVTLTATPNTGYKFVKWSDGITTATRTVKVTGAATYTAIFEKLPPEFTSASMTYLNKQISTSNKVICNEGFIISVDIT